LKHTLLKRYLPVFLQRTSALEGSAAYFDGYAGRGRYQNGALGTAGEMLKFAADVKYGRSKRDIKLFFSEMDQESYSILNELCDGYRKRGISINCENCDAGDFLKKSLSSFSRLPTFFFLDPCGVGLPFSSILEAANRGGKREWPATELVLNFSTEAIRRIGGHVNSKTPSKATMDRLSKSLGGDWWKDSFTKNIESPDEEVVRDFSHRLATETGMYTFAVPVRRNLNHKPIYYLIFGTRKSRGLWNFAHATALTAEEWRQNAQAAIDGNQLALDANWTPTLADREEAALPQIMDNIEALIKAKGEFELGDYPHEVFGAYLGEVRESIARKAVKKLHQKGLTITNGTGGKVENLRIIPS